MSLVNSVQFEKEFEKQFWSKPQAVGLVKGQAQRNVNVAQDAMIDEFENHAVTIELEAGVGSDNISNSISYTGPDLGKPNLFTFIGFDEGTNPVAKLRELLLAPIFVQVGRRTGLSYEINVFSPEEEDIEESTPMPDAWTDGSWARGVEDASIPNIDAYLAIDEKGRSGGGLQISGRKFKGFDSQLSPTPYVSEITNAFRNRLLSLL
jgi:hypothetical protein